MRASSSIACALPPRGGSISTETTNSPARSFRWRSVSCSGSGGATHELALADDERGARPALLVDRRADRRDLGRRGPAAAADDARAELLRVCGEVGEVRGGRVREDDAAAARGSRGRRSASRRAASRSRASARSRAAPPVAPAPWFAPIAATSSPASAAAARGRGHAADRVRVLVEREERDDRERRHARAPRRSRSSELVQLVERLDQEEVDAAALEQLRPAPRRSRPLVAACGLAERADRARDEDVAARDVARVACELHAGLVDRLDVVLEVVRAELAPVRSEGVRLDQVGTGADEAECSETTLSGARRFASSGQRRRATALETRTPMPPSPTSGGPSWSRSRNRSATRATLVTRSSATCEVKRARQPVRGIDQARRGDAHRGGIRTGYESPTARDDAAAARVSGE